LSNLKGGGADPEALFCTWRERRLDECERGWSAINLFAGITAPVLLVQGARDEFVCADHISSIASRLRGEVCWVTLRNAGHLLHHENPEQVTALIQRQVEHCMTEVAPLQDEGLHATLQPRRDRPERSDMTGTEKLRTSHPFGTDLGPSQLHIA
jgi:hypothetical protein